jgi:hypothetical protein
MNGCQPEPVTFVNKALMTKTRKKSRKTRERVKNVGKQVCFVSSLPGILLSSTVRSLESLLQLSHWN